jgi:NAD(P)-dependent dehydrogenase (short-subunit alcohol dehydrogenase family)
MAFGSTSTTDDVLWGIDLTGKVAVVTGASGGIGVETARALAAHGAHVVVAARDVDKTERAMEAIRVACPEAAVSAVALDLASLEGVRRAAGELSDVYRRIDLLVNNAGVMCTPFGRTVDGFETQFGTNHIGHFELTRLLTPALIAAGNARVVNLSSAGHGMGQINFEDPNFARRPYDPWEAYGQSKTANVLFAVELDRRLRDRGVRSFAVHPGGIRTDLGRNMSAADLTVLMERIKQAAPAGGGGMVWKTIAQGAATSVWAAVSPDLDGQGGVYCEDCAIAVLRSPDAASTGSGVMPYALDEQAAARLWELSERLIGDRPV